MTEAFGQQMDMFFMEKEVRQTGLENMKAPNELPVFMCTLLVSLTHHMSYSPMIIESLREFYTHKNIN